MDSVHRDIRYHLLHRDALSRMAKQPLRRRPANRPHCRYRSDAPDCFQRELGGDPPRSLLCRLASADPKRASGAGWSHLCTDGRGRRGLAQAGACLVGTTELSSNRQTDSMKISARAFLCATSIAIGVFAATTVLPQSPADGVLRVTVRNKETMEPIAGVRVTLTPTATAATPAQNGAISGRVVDKDGSTPLAGKIIWIDSLFTQNGVLQVRQRFTATTDLNGRYRASNIDIGQVRATLVLNARPVMTKGEIVGDEIFTANGVESLANFDLSRAPSQPPNIPATAPVTTVAAVNVVPAAAAGVGTQTSSTNADGVVVFDKLAPGTYQARAEREGYMGSLPGGPAIQFTPSGAVVAMTSAGTTVIVRAGTQPLDVTVLLMQSASISG